MRPFRSRPADTGRARSAHLATRYGQELRIARTTAGLTQVQLARLARVSQPEVSKAERGSRDISLDARCRLAAAAGHELGWRLYPTATVSLRDSGQLHIAEAIVRAAHPGWRSQLEGPVSADDLRAADLVLSSEAGVVHIEIERSLVDLQAQFRSAQLKRQALADRDGHSVRLLIAVPDTASARRRLAPVAALIASALPVPSRQVWRDLRAGTLLAGDGILFVRAPTRG